MASLPHRTTSNGLSLSSFQYIFDDLSQDSVTGNITEWAIYNGTTRPGLKKEVIREDLTNPSSCWTMDNEDINNLTLLDTREKVNGTINSSVTCGVPGKLGEACDYNRSNDVGIDLGDNFDFVDGQPFSISTWVNFDNLSSEIGRSQYIITKFDNAEFKILDAQWFMGLRSEGLSFTIFDDSQTNAEAPGNPANQWVYFEKRTPFSRKNEWVSLTLTYDGSSTPDGLKMYIDGEEIINPIDESSNPSFWNGMDDIPSHTGIGISVSDSMQANNQLFDNPMDGKIDQIAIWNKTLSPGEILQYYNNGEGTTCSQIIPCTDEDEDGFFAEGGDCGPVDRCVNVSLPELPAAFVKLNPNRFALDEQLGFGCNCEEVLSCKPGINKGEYKFGCTKGTENVWRKQKGWSQQCPSEVSNTNNKTFEDPFHGKIDFFKKLNLTGITSLGRYIKFFNNIVRIHSDELPALNGSATIYLNNLTFNNPRILKNGKVCPSTICKLLTYVNGTLVFNVTQID